MPTYTPLYTILPPTPSLHPNGRPSTATINNITLWYTQYGPPPLTTTKTPVLFLHGGKISSRWFSPLLHHVSSTLHHPALAIDTRGHGHSTDDPSVPLAFDLFASDAAALLAHLGIPRVAVVGWSDGANTALALAMSHPDLVERVFAYGANYRPDQFNAAGVAGIPFLAELGRRLEEEWKAVNPRGGEDGAWEEFGARVAEMQGRWPMWTGEDFKKIKERGQGGPVMWFVEGDEEEVVQRGVAGEMKAMVAGSSLMVLPEVGHFGMVQDVPMMKAVLGRWLVR